MDSDLKERQKHVAAEFWKSYFGKFRRRVEDHEVSETGQAPLSADTVQLPHAARREAPASRRSNPFNSR